jgi:hypothetical protein
VRNIFVLLLISLYLSLFNFRESHASLLSHVVPFYSVHTFQTLKGIYFIIWCEILDIFKSRAHTTVEGFNRIKAFRDFQHYYRVTIDPVMPDSVLAR